MNGELVAFLAQPEVVAHGHDVEDHQSFDPFRGIEREAEGNMGAAVVPHDAKAIEAQFGHQLGEVERHRALGKGAVVAVGRGTIAAAVTAQVRCDDGEMARQRRRHAMPHGVRFGIAVNEQKWRPATSDACEDLDAASQYALLMEAGE